MKTLEVSRNVANDKDVEAWLVDTFVDRYQELAAWITTVVRKWVLKNAPGTKMAVSPESMSGLPEWLRKAMDSDDPPMNIEFTPELGERIRFVLDYMADLIDTKPDTKIASIGFDVAEKRAKDWHEKLTSVGTAPDAADGENIVKTYPTGYTWRYLIGSHALNTEGQLMGHCVGAYHQVVMKGHVSVFSLRDQNNEPHVTIEVSRDDRINQIKGKANLAVVDRYLPYVTDFLKSRKWLSINFDGARAIEKEVTEWLAFSAPAWYEASGVRASQLPTTTYTRSVLFLVSNADTRLRLGGFSLDSVGGTPTKYKLGAFTDLDDGTSRDFMCSMMNAKDIRIGSLDDSATSYFFRMATWSNSTGSWKAPENDAARALCKGLTGFADAKLCIKNGSFKGWYNSEFGIVFYSDVPMAVVREELLHLNVNSRVFSSSRGFVNGGFDYAPDTETESWIAKQVAGKSVRTDSDSAILNSLLLALKQPDVAAIKAAYLKVKSRDSVNDALFKSLGFQTGGRAINALGLVLLASLPIKNSKLFREYVFSKPNTTTCLLEVLLTPDHLAVALKTYGLDSKVLDLALDVFRNEYIRLLPSLEELEALDIDLPVESKIKRAITKASSHKTNKQRSKDIWGQI